MKREYLQNTSSPSVLFSDHMIVKSSDNDSGSDSENIDSGSDSDSHNSYDDKYQREFEYFQQESPRNVPEIRPAERFILGKTSETTGYPMIRVIEFDDISEPPSPAKCAVAVVGYFKSWALASKHVRVLGAIYSLHYSYHDARIC
ncbi:hypothetical protein BT96DRAFT_993112 [Gymnopus androsaceus JB14]|uniref:Uncharacterized protein n=1 Tax=Gymnopus androsaceus JB14 TaxID=1447944 RepID=A0A6A4HQA7_9AGAR|nr:hypothetical protein BT96DRAFT_993112 [Gymnopus androsaceus JB14]